ncbi:hypothetical protein PFISCL1PPCAC_26502, partial [Pristionchus fissidentatus]
EENTETSDTTGQGEVSATSNYVTNEDATVDAAVEQLFVDHIETTTPLVYVEEGMTNVDIEGFAKEEIQNNEPVLENVEAEIKEQTIDPVNITDDIDQPIGEDSSEVIGESSDSTVISIAFVFCLRIPRPMDKTMKFPRRSILTIQFFSHFVINYRLQVIFRTVMLRQLLSNSSDKRSIRGSLTKKMIWSSPHFLRNCGAKYFLNKIYILMLSQ